MVFMPAYLQKGGIQARMLRKDIKLMENWLFTGRDGIQTPVSLPHTWNATDGQDGGNDYYRGTCLYETVFPKPEFDAQTQCVYLEFQGVNASASVECNGSHVISHDGGYSTFRADITSFLQDENRLSVKADNSVSDSIYPQKADFTFYGGIYRDVLLRIIPKDHFEMDYYGAQGIKVTPQVKGKHAQIRVESWHKAEGAKVSISLYDAGRNCVAQGSGTDVTLEIKDVHLWNGRRDPYLYTAKAELVKDGTVLDEVCVPFGVRTFRVDPRKGFYLNGRRYPLHGVSRHQDRKGIGNALLKEHHDEDMKLIREIGANTIRLAHYQHDQYFYDLCDRYGMIVWAEIPYISEHLPGGRQDTVNQMKELIFQNYNHPCIVTWGVSNEITISTKDRQDMLDNHRMLNDLCHSLDPTRVTTLACYAMCNPFSKVVHITDIVSYNLYLGWYVPGLFLNDVFFRLFHARYPKRCIGYSEYGAEGMPNLHSEKPRRGDHTEEYQALYHEYMLKCFAKYPFIWATHVWNMFDFAADARDQGGEPGMNHKGLVTFDRKTKKDSFYLYQAYWTHRPMVHICSKRFQERGMGQIQVKVYSNQPEVSLYRNGKLLEKQRAQKVFVFSVNLEKGAETKIEAVVDTKKGKIKDQALFQWKEHPKSYKLEKKRSKSANWV